MQNEWWLAEKLFIDEVSLLSEQLISEIDHALHFATEHSDEWVGGIDVIFVGDLYQYPPICANPLYSPISDMSSLPVINGHQWIGQVLMTCFSWHFLCAPYMHQILD